METNEHTEAGNQVRIETEGLKNRYLHRGQKASPLQIVIMKSVDGIPVPTTLVMTPGEIVAMAGDYYTQAGWGKKLSLPESNTNQSDLNHDTIIKAFEAKESEAFTEAYADLSAATRAQIDEIYSITKRTYIPFFSSLNSLFKELVNMFSVKGYYQKLDGNEAHFSPWSLRAYIVGHNQALDSAQLAYCFKQLAEGAAPPELMQEKVESILSTARRNPTNYGLAKATNDKELYEVLSHRYHALALSQDLFAMHFYSDHFAAGHLSRIGRMRETVPQALGLWGSILINTMHDEDNKRDVEVYNPYQIQPDESNDAWDMPEIDYSAQGDSSYDEASNDENANQLISGMEDSVGDIYRIIAGRPRPKPLNYGGLKFMPEVNPNIPQSQPLLIQANDGKIYARSASTIKKLGKDDYESLISNPAASKDYKALSRFGAFLMVVQLRVFGFIFAPKTLNNEVEVKKQRQESIGLDDIDKDLNDLNLLTDSPNFGSREVQVSAAKSLPPTSSVSAYRKAPATTLKDSSKHLVFPGNADSASTDSNPSQSPSYKG